AAGVRVGDVILSANGQRVDSHDALRNVEGLQAIGTPIALEVIRDGRPLQLSAALREHPRAVAGVDIDPRLEGATFAELPERVRQTGQAGVLVESVARGSRAARNGLQPGDIVVAATTGTFADLSGFRANFTQAPAQLILRIVRGNGQGNLPMQ
ncbi:MAG TPA: PDZ domain-containing protein, partial [Lysobacter sp.]